VVARKKVSVRFDGGLLLSDAGVLASAADVCCRFQTKAATFSDLMIVPLRLRADRRKKRFRVTDGWPRPEICGGHSGRAMLQYPPPEVSHRACELSGAVLAINFRLSAAI
jgi:hypothetical protein